MQIHKPLIPLFCLVLATTATAQDLRLTPDDPPGNFLDEVERAKKVQSEILRADVDNALSEARRSEDPAAAIRDLKLLLAGIQRAPELDGATRSRLRQQIGIVIRDLQRREVEQNSERAQSLARLTAARQRQQRLAAEERKQKLMKELFERINQLKAEGDFKLAEEVAAAAFQLDPNSVAARTAQLNARFQGNLNDLMAIRDLRARNTIAALLDVERSFIPPAGDIVYPDAEKWRRLTEARKKNSANDLRGESRAEAKIRRSLDEPTQFEFIDDELQDVAEFISDLHGIPVVLDRRNLSLVGIGSETPVSFKVKGVSLKSALRLMLRQLDLSYTIINEVLMITTPEAAQANQKKKIYSIEDLVTPPQQINGGNPFRIGG